MAFDVGSLTFCEYASAGNAFTEQNTFRTWLPQPLIMTTAFETWTRYDADRPIYTHPRFLPGARIVDCTVKNAMIAEGCFVDKGSIEDSIVGIRAVVKGGCTIRRSVLLGADYYEDDALAPSSAGIPLGIGRDVTLDGVIVDKNARIGEGARLTNSAGLQQADGDGYYIRDGIIIVPKDGIIKPGTVV